ncbi:MAG TPA: UDP-N-acetylglucosamine 4,6-dehydratase (inverting) [Candidatus Dormibacteraeota bacterium]|jgi:UDP-N-acetylglucosamine 4,6-dehydratase|nr:UDP-N-acetylglucosamine 4,6-dehydratase (inverting) [Candidatus Dormibacteraeota bacterium]
MNPFEGTTILITGGTGSFGQHFTKYALAHWNPAAIRIYSRDELKQHDMARAIPDEKLRFFLGDVRDSSRLRRAVEGAQIVIHAAALKQVPACEYNPFEAIKTNILGTQNVAEVCIDVGVQKAVALSTDKAVSPANLYGATKLCAEKLFVQSNVYTGTRPTRLSCVRYGNVVGSRGSVVPVFREQIGHGELTITDARMTRFWITLDQAVEFVAACIGRMRGGEVFIPRIPSTRVVDLAEAIAPGLPIRYTGIRPGEKLHEALLTAEEARHSVDAGDHLVIEPEHPFWTTATDNGRRALPEGYSYTSDSNDVWLDVVTLRQLLGETQPVAETTLASR